MVLTSLTVFCVSIIIAHINIVESVAQLKPTIRSTPKPLSTSMPDMENPTADDLQRNIIFRFFKKYENVIVFTQ